MELGLREGAALTDFWLKRFQEVECATPEMWLRENLSGGLDGLRQTVLEGENHFNLLRIR